MDKSPIDKKHELNVELLRGQVENLLSCVERVFRLNVTLYKGP